MKTRKGWHSYSDIIAKANPYTNTGMYFSREYTYKHCVPTKSLYKAVLQVLMPPKYSLEEKATMILECTGDDTNE